MILKDGKMWFILVGLFLAVGCAQMPKESGFSDVQSLAGGRLGYRLHWNRESTEDDRVSREIEKLLREELTVDAAVQISLLNNPSLQVIYEELGITQADVVQAGLLENPVFIGSARFPDRPPSGTNLEFGVAQNFLNILMLPARKKLAASQFEAVKLRVADQVLRFATQVRKAYYESIGAKQVEEMRQLMAHTAQASYEMAQRLHQAGNISDLNLAKERAQYEHSRMELAKSKEIVLATREQLTCLMGLWGRLVNWKIPDKLPELPEDEIPLEHLESIAIANRLDLASARQEVEVLAQALGISVDWRWVASADIGVSSERDTDGQWVTGPTLSLQLPIFDQGQAKISRLEAQLRQRQKRMTSLAVEIRSEVRTLRNRLLMKRDLIEHYKNVVIPLRGEIVDLARKEYNYMLVGVFELLIAKQDEFNTWQEYIEVLRDYWVICAELEQAVGGNLTPTSGSTHHQKIPSSK